MLALSESSGMNHNVIETEARAMKFSRANYSQRKLFAVTRMMASNSLFKKKEMGTRMRYHFDLV